MAAILPWLIVVTGSSFAQLRGDSITMVDSELIVDCKLPPQVRKLGASVIRQMPGGVIKLSKAECEIRGGEYVAYDAADPAKALKIWMDAANQGDAGAQNRVGQIYELGVGTAPDYAQAAKWYAKAAQNGSRTGAINLASLYDRGLGVPKDAAAASEFYRKAQGVLPNAGDAGKVENRAPSDKSQRPSEQAKPVSVALLDVGSEAGAKPTIVLQDPTLPVTRGENEVRLRGEVKTKDIIGWVRAKAGLSTLRVNEREIAADQFGYFSTSVQVKSDGTRVSIVAVDKVGGRDEVAFFLRPGAENEIVVPSTQLKLARGDLGTFYALIIGNRHYKDTRWGELPNSESDARSVASILERKYGFQKPKLLIDATRAQIMGALNDFAKSLGPSDNLLIYYAGHGAFALGKRGYWIPVDGGKEDDSNWIDNVRIGDYVQKMSAARKVLVVSDSCYAGAMTGAENGAIPTVRQGLSDEQFLAAAGQLAQLRSRTILGSGGLAPVLEGGAKDHSVFARAFLDVLEANNMPIEGYRVFLALDGKVLRLAQQQNFDQAPLYAAMQQAGHEGGDFIFVPTIAVFSENSVPSKFATTALENIVTGAPSSSH